MTATIPTINSPLRAVHYEPPGQNLLPIPPVTHFGVARTHREVLDCWRLVYNCYCEKGLINPNSYTVHTSPQAVNVQTAVIFGRTQGRIDSTLSVIPDSPAGLPLDQVYPHILDHLRNQGRRLVEVGLLADARENVGKAMDQAFGAMRYGFYRALYSNADIVIGVHPRHADFYIRMMGLEVIGPMSSHPKVNDRPVVPLLLDTSRIRLEPLPRLLRYIKANPLEAQVFDCRFRFGTASMARSSIQRFVNHAALDQKFSRFKTVPSRMPMHHIGML